MKTGHKKRHLSPEKVTTEKYHLPVVRPQVSVMSTDVWHSKLVTENEKLRASLCKILISSFAHKMDFAHNFPVDFF